MVGRSVMRLSSFFKRLFSPTRSPKSTRSNRFLLEVLEDRTLLNGTTLLVQLKPGLDAAVFNAPTTSNLLVGADFRATPINGLFQLEVDDAKLSAVINHLRNYHAVAYAEPQTIYSIQLTPNDPNFTNGNLWGLNGTFGIDAPEAWDTTTGTTTPIVAVIDTGVDYRHADLFRNIWINQGEIPASVRAAITSNANWDTDGDGLITFWDLNDARNQGAGKITDLDSDGRITGADILRSSTQGGWSDGVDADANNYRDDLVGWNFVNNTNDPLDDHNHGTHVAGTIGGVGNNSTGVVGVNWKVQIMPLKFLNSSGSGTDANGASAVRYAANNGSQVSNNSWGGGGASSTLVSAIDYARSRDHLFIAAAGNEASNTDTTANYPSGYNLANIISVAATTSGGGLAGFSNYGLTTVDLGAPGQNIYSTVSNNGYAFFSGTSMATPHVAGAAALLLAQNPSMTYAELKNRLLTTTNPLNSLQGQTVTGGLLNIGKALQNGPEVTVLDGTTNLTDGVSTVSVGSTFAGIPLSNTFTVRNTGNQTLTLGSTIAVPTGFTLTSGFSTTTLAPGASTTFTVRLNATANGTYTGQVSFASNDANENPFNFTLTGTVSPVVIIDNGDTGFTTAGSWTPFSNQGYQNDIHYAASGSGSNVATWTLAVAPGTFRVSATWYAYANRATDAPFTVYDGSTALGNVRLNQELSPNDFTDAGVGWEDIGTYTISGNTLMVKLANNANEYVIADAIRIERTGSVPSASEIQVLDGSTDLADGSATVNFGTTPSGVPVSKTFTVKNLGDAALTLGSISVPNGFTVTAGFGVSMLAAGALTTFTVRLDATTAGSFSGAISFSNNDADENPFNFTLQGSVSAPVVAQIIDNGEAGFSTTGIWTPLSGQGYQNDIHYGASGSGLDVATWTFAVTPGTYRVSATWFAFFNRATDSPFTIFDGSISLATVRLNQELTPNDYTDAGVGWENIGTYTIAGNTLVVKLANNANEYVIADGIRIERLASLPTGPEIQVLDGSTNLADGLAAVNFGVTSAGLPVSKTFTVKNLGDQALTLGTISVPAGYTVTSGFGVSTLAAGASTTFTVRLDATTAGSFSGAISFSNNDADENPFNFTVQGSVSAPVAAQIIDNGAAGFSTTGSWTPFGGQGYQNAIHYAASGSGSNVATWTFAVTPGTYRVSATWYAFSNRATDTPFTVFDGSTPLGSVRLNQELAPNDFTDAGVGWESIGGTFTITGSTLIVQMTNDANEYVIADAIRIERIS